MCFLPSLSNLSYLLFCFLLCALSTLFFCSILLSWRSWICDLSSLSYLSYLFICLFDLSCLPCLSWHLVVAGGNGRWKMAVAGGSGKWHMAVAGGSGRRQTAIAGSKLQQNMTDGSGRCQMAMDGRWEILSLFLSYLSCVVFSDLLYWFVLFYLSSLLDLSVPSYPNGNRWQVGDCIPVSTFSILLCLIWHYLSI